MADTHPRPFDVVLERLCSEPPADLPFSGGEPIRPDLLAAAERPYSKILEFRLVSRERAWLGYAKLGDPDAIAAEHERLERFRGVFESLDPRLGVAKPVAHFPDLGALVTEAVPGRDLGAEIKARLGRRTRKVPSKLLEACRLAGAWLRRFQAVTSQPEATYSLDDMSSYVTRRLLSLEAASLYGFSKIDRRAVLARFDTLAQRVTPDDLSVAGIHADYAPGNLIISGERLVVLDFPSAQSGSVYHDITHLHHHLGSLADHPRYSSSVTGPMKSALLSGFDEPRVNERPIFRLFEIQHATCLLAEGLVRPAPRWRPASWLAGHLQRQRLGRLRRLSARKSHRPESP